MNNVSRFNAIQDKILGLVYEYLTEIKDAVSVHASLPLDEINDEIMAHLENSFTVEFGNSGLNWRDLLEVLLSLRLQIRNGRRTPAADRGGNIPHSPVGSRTSEPSA